MDVNIYLLIKGKSTLIDIVNLDKFNQIKKKLKQNTTMVYIYFIKTN